MAVRHTPPTASRCTHFSSPPGRAIAAAADSRDVSHDQKGYFDNPLTSMPTPMAVRPIAPTASRCTHFPPPDGAATSPTAVGCAGAVKDPLEVEAEVKDSVEVEVEGSVEDSVEDWGLRKASM
jgi:hypothetical protein